MAGVAGNTVGQPSSFMYQVSQMFGPPMVADVTGGTGGPPTNHTFADASPTATSAGQAAALANYGVVKAASAPHMQPVFWLFVILAISVVMLSHVAHLSLK